VTVPDGSTTATSSLLDEYVNAGIASGSASAGVRRSVPFTFRTAWAGVTVIASHASGVPGVFVSSAGTGVRAAVRSASVRPLNSAAGCVGLTFGSAKICLPSSHGPRPALLASTEATCPVICGAAKDVPLENLLPDGTARLIGEMLQA